MNILSVQSESVVISCSKEELLALHAALNEVCNGIDLFEFETRVGATRDYMTGLFLELGLALDRME